MRYINLLVWYGMVNVDSYSAMLRTRWTHDAADSNPTRLSLRADGRRLAP